MKILIICIIIYLVIGLGVSYVFYRNAIVDYNSIRDKSTTEKPTVKEYLPFIYGWFYYLIIFVMLL